MRGCSLRVMHSVQLGLLLIWPLVVRLPMAYVIVGWPLEEWFLVLNSKHMLSIKFCGSRW